MPVRSADAAWSDDLADADLLTLLTERFDEGRVALYGPMQNALVSA